MVVRGLSLETHSTFCSEVQERQGVVVTQALLSLNLPRKKNAELQLALNDFKSPEGWGKKSQRIAG